MPTPHLDSDCDLSTASGFYQTPLHHQDSGRSFADSQLADIALLGEVGKMRRALTPVPKKKGALNRVNDPSVGDPGITTLSFQKTHSDQSFESVPSIGKGSLSGFQS